MEQVSQKPRPKVFFRSDPVLSVLLLLVIFFASQIVAIFLISLYPAVRSWTGAEATNWLQNAVEAQFSYILIAEVISVGSILWILKSLRRRPSVIGLVKPRVSDIGYGFITYGLYFLTYMVVIVIATQVLTSVDFNQEQRIGFENAYDNLGLLMTFVSLVILPPIAEEIMFRGFLFTSLRAKYTFWPTAIITSILFAIAHLQFGSDAPLLWVAAIDTFILSCFLCYLRERTGGLTAPILLHAIKNCVAFMILFGPRFL